MIIVVFIIERIGKCLNDNVAFTIYLVNFLGYHMSSIIQ